MECGNFGGCRLLVVHKVVSIAYLTRLTPVTTALGNMSMTVLRASLDDSAGTVISRARAANRVVDAERIGKRSPCEQEQDRESGERFSHTKNC